MSRIVSVFLCLSFAVSVFGQSPEQSANRAIFNRIEFFVNTRMTDSIYALASEKFRSAISQAQLEFRLNALYRHGRIKNVETLDFRERTATYGLEFSDTFVEVRFALADDLRFDVLLFKSAEKPAAEPQAQEATIGRMEEKSAVDVLMDSVGDAYVRKAEARSLAIGIFHRDAYRTYFYGETQKHSGIRPTEETLYEIGDLGNVLTATVLANLVIQNAIQLDDPIAEFLPDSLASHPDLRKITFKSLANHTSGLPALPDSSETIASLDSLALYACLKGYKADREPGESYLYSPLGYALLGELLATVAKKTFMETLRETLLGPLHMSHTTDTILSEERLVDRPLSTSRMTDPAASAAPPVPRLLSGHDETGGETPMENHPTFPAAGGLKSTVKDLMLFAVEQFKMPLNDLQNAMALTRQFTFLTPDYVDIGLAWQMSLADEDIYLWHNGQTQGFRSFIGLSPEGKTAVVILSNAAIGMAETGKFLLERLMGFRN